MSDTRAVAYTFGVGRQTVTSAGTAVQLSTTSVPCKKVVVQAETDNTNPVTVGDANVVGALATRKGIALTAGSTYTLDVTNLTQVYIDAVTNTEGVTFHYMV